MNLDFYRNYIAIIECGTLSAAAEKQHVAQSALSMQVRQFETEYGALLFRREARQMVPTDAGKILYDRARSIVMLEESAHKEVAACAAGLQGTVRLGMTQAYPDAEMESLLCSFQKENPELRYELHERSSGDLAELLRNGLIEVAVIRSSPVLPSDLEKQISIAQKLCVIFRRDRPWFQETDTVLPLRALDAVPLAVSRGFEGLLRDLFVRAEIRPEVMSVSTSRSMAVMWARTGAMAAVVCTEEPAALEDQNCRCLPLGSDDEYIARLLQPVRSFVTLKHRLLSPAAKHFLAFSRAALLREACPRP